MCVVVVTSIVPGERKRKTKSIKSGKGKKNKKAKTEGEGLPNSLSHNVSILSSYAMSSENKTTNKKMVKTNCLQNCTYI
jgi:hypothetical protein